MCECYKEINKLKSLLLIERQKTKIYKSIAESKLGSKIDDVIESDAEDVIEPVKVKKKASTENTFENTFELLKVSNQYSKHLKLIKTNRNSRMTKLSLDLYVILLNQHKEQLEAIFLEKKYTTKKIVSAVFPLSFTPIEYRLLFLEGLGQHPLEKDEILQFKSCLELYLKQESAVQFEESLLIKYLLNYSLALFPLKDLISTFVGKMNNIIYVDKKSKDPYSFYCLSEIKKTKRVWKIDNRLEHLTFDLSNNIKTYLVQIFRNLYKDSVKNNIFSKDFKQYQILETEGAQILNNIFLSINFKELNSILKDIVKSVSTYVPTALDKFDIVEDIETSQEYYPGDNDTIDIIKELFDNVDDERAKEIKNILII